MNLVQIAQHADDLDRATDFYTMLLERPPLARLDEAEQVFFDLDGARLRLDRSAPSALIFLQVDNVHETLERLGALVEVVTAPDLVRTHMDDALGPEGREEWQASIRDSEGNTLGLVAFQRA